jgi:hypothetical protein
MPFRSVDERNVGLPLAFQRELHHSRLARVFDLDGRHSIREMLRPSGQFGRLLGA